MSNPSDFPTDNLKVNYAISYLRGTAFQHFQTQLEDEELEWADYDWYNNWRDFTATLRENFGTINAVFTAPMTFVGAFAPVAGPALAGLLGGYPAMAIVMAVLLIGAVGLTTRS